MIRLRDIEKTFTSGSLETHVLKGIDLDVSDGEYVALMGSSGTGKSTLMNILGCLDRPTGGTYHLDDRDVTGLSDEELSTVRNEKIGFVFQQFHLLPRSNAVQNVLLPLVYSRRYPSDAKKRAESLLGMVGLGDRMHHHPGQLSGGQQQRVAIARSMANNPSVLLCDEPTANLDLSTGREILEILQRLNLERGVTIICATHDHRMLDICDRLMWIRDGRIERIARRDEVHIEVGAINGQTE